MDENRLDENRLDENWALTLAAMVVCPMTKVGRTEIGSRATFWEILWYDLYFWRGGVRENLLLIIIMEIAKKITIFFCAAMCGGTVGAGS